jgi:hypothetical protein
MWLLKGNILWHVKPYVDIFINCVYNNVADIWRKGGLRPYWKMPPKGAFTSLWSHKLYVIYLNNIFHYLMGIYHGI